MKQEELLKLKQKQDEASKKIDNLKGRKDSIIQQLKDVEGCTNKKEAQKKVEAYELQEQTLQKKYDEGIEELEAWLEEKDIDIN